jgi:hypothetical protein
LQYKINDMARKKFTPYITEFEKKYHPEFNQVLAATWTKSLRLEDMCAYGGCLYETYGEEYERVLAMVKENPKRVWTILDGEGSALVVSAGWHYVNRLGYLITEEEWESPEEEYFDY